MRAGQNPTCQHRQCQNRQTQGCHAHSWCSRNCFQLCLFVRKVTRLCCWLLAEHCLLIGCGHRPANYRAEQSKQLQQPSQHLTISRSAWLLSPWMLVAGRFCLSR